MTETVPLIKLNYLQRLMWRWSQHLAYNAVHVIHVRGHADMSRWQHAALATIQEVGLGHPQLTAKGEAHFLPLTTLNIVTTRMNLPDLVNQELNHSFALTEFPLRFFIIPSSKDSHYFCITYNHWIADAYAMRMLLQSMVARYRGDAELPPALTLRAPPFQTLFKPHLGHFPGLLWLNQMLQSLKQFYNAHRLKLQNSLDFHSQHVLQTLPGATLAKLKTFCKNKNVSMNDLFVTLLAQVMGQFSAPARAKKKPSAWRRKRDHIAISTIADIRHAAKESLEQVLGQYLSSYTVVLAAPEQRSMENLLEEVHACTTRSKAGSRVVRSHYNFATALWLWDRNPSPKRRALLFHKNAPICAGISNVNVRDEWLAKESSQNDATVLDYWRASPTGPLSPLVFSITTFREQLTICLAYRCSALTEAVATTLCQAFCEKLTALVSPE